MFAQSPTLSVRVVLVVALLLALVASPELSAQQQTPTFSKGFSPATIGPGSVSTLRFDIGNSSASPVTALAFVDNLPAGMTIASPAAASSSCGGVLDAPEGGGTIAFDSGGVAANSTCSILVNVTTATPGTHTNVSGDLTSSAGNSENATADLTVATDRPGFGKGFAPSSIFFGTRSVLTLTIDNTANNASAVNLTFTDPLPSGMVIASPAVASTTCGGGLLSAPAGGATISYGPQFFNDATVGAGASCTVSVEVLGNSVGSLGNVTGELTSTLTNNQTIRSSGKASAVLTVDFETLRLTKSFVDDPTPPGGVVNLEFTIRNLDRRFEATDIAFTDDLDAVLGGLVALEYPPNPCGPGSVLGGTSVIFLTGGSLPPDPDGTCTFTIPLLVPEGADAASYLNTTSTISGTIDGEPVTGTPATDTLFVAPAPLLTKEFLDDPVGAGGAVTLEFTITNTSATSSATQIAFEDIFDVILPTAADVPAPGFCGPSSTATFTPLTQNNPARLAVAGASLPPGESCAFSLVLDVVVGAQANTYPNVTSPITARVDDQLLTGSPAADDLVVVGGPLLTKEFTDDPVAAGGTVTLEFTLTLSEDSPGDATGITFSDNLDATLAGLAATGLPLADVCGPGSSLGGTPMTILLTGATLAPGETCAFSVSLAVPADAASGIYQNTTSSVASTVLDTPTSSNPAVDNLRVAGLTLTKEFTNDPVLPGGQVNLRFTIENTGTGGTATGIAFQDDLDAVIDNLTGLGLPLADVCGTGSSLIGTSGNRVLVFDGGSLAAGASCSFDVTLQVPAAAVPETYVNRTTAFRAIIGGQTVFFDNATDLLVVSSDFLALTKAFIDDPVAPGDPVTLRFTLTNLDPDSPATAIEFTDDLEAALAGLASISGALPDVCGVGSLISGTDLLTFAGGSLAGGGSCSFDVVLAVPADVLPGTLVINTTSPVTGSIGGLEVTGDPASDVLEILFVAFSKAFSGAATPGGTVTLSFTIENLTDTAELSALSFSDDLEVVLSGLAATGLPDVDVCGDGSIVMGTSFLTLSGGNLLQGGSCTFAVDLLVPVDAVPGDYPNTTSPLFQQGIAVADPATATLTVVGTVDADNDGVPDGADVCPGTVIPEGVPTQELRPNRYALIDDDLEFEHGLPGGGTTFGSIFGTDPGRAGQREFTTTDTAGCSCEQIIEALGLGQGHVRFGCSLGAMRTWIDLVSGAPTSPKESKVHF